MFPRRKELGTWIIHRDASSGGIYRQCFGHENRHIRENQPSTTLVFIQNLAQRRQYQFVLEEIRFGRLVFSAKTLDCRLV
jgi:hypothetical protein